MRNIIVNKDGELLSIDEGDIFGKRDRIFNHNEYCCKKNITEDILNEVIEDILSEKDKKIKLIEKKMNEYGFNKFIPEFKNRFNDYREIVMNEWLK